MDKNTEKLTVDELYKIATQAETDTFLSALGKTYNENLISDYLAYILDDRRSHLGVAPLNALLQCANSNYKVDENDNITIEREHCFDKNSRIDILIHNITKSFYIGIENKIFSDEGENQTERYAKYLLGKSIYTLNGEKNIGIFLTPTGIEAKDRDFKNITYKQILNAFPKNTGKNAFYDDFMNHIKSYIVSNSFSDCDILFINKIDKSIIERIILKYKREKDERLQAIYDKSIALRNIFFDTAEDVLRNYIDCNKFKIRRSSFYIQFYKKEWEENEGIHFEIIIPYNKGLLFPGGRFFIMIHKEKKGNCVKKTFRDQFGFKTNLSKFNYPGKVLCEKSYEISDILSLESISKKQIEQNMKDVLEKFNIDKKTEIIDGILSKENS